MFREAVAASLEFGSLSRRLLHESILKLKLSAPDSGSLK